MIEAVFPSRAVSRPTQHRCMPQETDDYSWWRVDGCSTGFQRPSTDSQRWWVRLILYGQLHITEHFKENHRGNETAVHHTTVGGGCCRGRDRRRTDCIRNRSAVLQRERLGNCLPVARQRSDQGFPARCSAPPLRGHAQSDGKGFRAGPRPGDVNGRTPRRSDQEPALAHWFGRVRPCSRQSVMMAITDPARPVGRNHPPPRRTVTLDRHPDRHLVISGTPSRSVSRATADVSATVIGEHGTSEVLLVLGHRGGSPHPRLTRRPTRAYRGDPP